MSVNIYVIKKLKFIHQRSLYFIINITIMQKTYTKKTDYPTTGYKKVRCFKIIKEYDKTNYSTIVDNYDIDDYGRSDFFGDDYQGTKIILGTEKLGIAKVKIPSFTDIIHLDEEKRSPHLYVDEVKDYDDKIFDENYRCYANGYRFIVGKTTYSETRMVPGIYFNTTPDQAKKDKNYY
ncbi:hypothetical protein QKC54_gp1046 [Megavirus baoshan]|uniref:Uncharacterized protein n=1 Tax=Megavirus baoshan TaxID=2496520 RepID=A0A3Q8U8U4_9VIRU|nr:hypothetical protein QKC54_gp1046 [Megavirus baoshan]AZL89701.1 hypothetical protein Mb0026 [Megavirus baoshan]